MYGLWMKNEWEKEMARDDSFWDLNLYNCLSGLGMVFITIMDQLLSDMKKKKYCIAYLE